jgi:ABC-2 type transport system permease protein
VNSRVSALIRKEFIQIVRDRRTLAIILVQPAILLLLFGYAINTTVEHLPTIVLDQAGDRVSRDFIQALNNSGIFDVVDSARDPEMVRQAVDAGAVKVGVLIPSDFARDLAAGRPTEVQLLIDGSDPNIAQSALFAAVAVGQVRSALALSARLERIGLVTSAPAIDVRPVVLYNPNMASINFMVPGLIGLILQNQTLILTALAVVRERESGTLEQLVVTPIRRWEFMVGKVLPYLLLAFANVCLALAVGAFWFQVEIAGSIGLLLVLSVLFSISSLSLGLLISTVSQSQREATQLATFIILPTFLLSGFMYPRETMPLPLHDLGYLLPLTYFLRILRGIVLKGVGLDMLWGDVLPLAVMSLLLLTVSTWRFRKQLD